MIEIYIKFILFILIMIFFIFKFCISYVCFCVCLFFLKFVLNFFGELLMINNVILVWVVLLIIVGIKFLCLGVLSKVKL